MGTGAFRGKVMLTCEVKLIEQTLTFPTNSGIVLLDQEAVNVVIHLLEPQLSDSFVSYGFFNSIFEQKEFYSDQVVEKIHQGMLGKDENLRQEFEEIKLKKT